MAGILEGLTAGGIFASIAISATVSAVTYGISVALAPTPKKPTQSTRIDQLRTIAKDNTAPMRVVYGTFRTSGLLLYARSVNEHGKPAVGGRFLHFVLALAHGPVQDIYDIQLNDEPADSTKFQHLAAIQPFNGRRDQAMFRGPMYLSRQTGRFTTEAIECKLPDSWLRKNRPLREVAGVYCVLKHDPQVFPGGAPNLRATIRGRLVYDPRDDVSQGGWQRSDDPDTWRWSNNAALRPADLEPHGEAA